MKPDAPAEYRGPFQAAKTSAEGIRLCEHLPMTARQAHHLAVVQDDRPVGVISRRLLNIAGGCSDDDTDSHRPIDPWVNTDVPTLRSDATLGRAAAAMLDRKAPAVTVVDHAHALIGLLPEDAILQVVAKHLV